MPKKHGLTFGVILTAALGCVAGTAQAQQRHSTQTTASLPGATAIEAVRGGDSRPPIGWVQFCAKPAYAAECRVDTSEPETVELNPRMWRLVTSINLRVNREIEPITDMDHWGVVERWDMAEDGKGDCEEYVNIKRKRLVEAGVPRRALRVVVVIDDENAGHAVLMLRTDRGDFILDNKRNAVLPWSQTGYVFVKRESQERTGWVALGGVTGTQVAQR
jgi:predicted transglutaminase-like cysteine proteinase